MRIRSEREKGPPDARGVVAEDHEIVHLQKISGGNADHGHDPGFETVLQAGRKRLRGGGVWTGRVRRRGRNMGLQANCSGLVDPERG